MNLSHRQDASACVQDSITCQEIQRGHGKPQSPLGLLCGATDSDSEGKPHDSAVLLDFQACPNPLGAVHCSGMVCPNSLPGLGVKGPASFMDNLVVS